MDVIKSVASICNFTLEIHLREDELSGKINEFPNGSLSYTGVFENLMDSKGIYSSLYQKRFQILVILIIFSLTLTNSLSE